MNVSLATIPPRIRNKSIFKSIDGFLNQTIEINKIFINLPLKFNRFNQLTDNEINEIENYNEKVKVTFTGYDSPLLKYIGALSEIDDEEYIFIGDDDQVYKKDLLENMKKGIFDDKAVYQNRFHIIKHGTGGIIHGFVGLMMKKKIMNNFKNFEIPPVCWIDDQLMSIYLFLNNIDIYPTIINDFDDIYEKISNNECEHIGEGALCNMKKPRSEQIRELEKFYNVIFLKKNNHLGKGKLKKVSENAFEEKITFYQVILDQLTPHIKNNIEELAQKYPQHTFKFFTIKDFNDRYPNVKLSNDYLLNYFTDKFGVDLVNESKDKNPVYINRNFQIKKDFDIYNYLLDDDKIFYNPKMIYLVKKEFNFI